MPHATEFAPGIVVQRFVPPQPLSQYKLIAFDMDSTLINMECVDEIAAAVGKKDEVAAITEATMRGDIADFKESLRQRIALLQGVCMDALQEIAEHRLQLNPGAQTLVKACKDAGLKTLLLSGGFTYFADLVRNRLGLDYARSNVLEIDGAGKLTGQLVPQAWGDICDGAEKRRSLLELASFMRLSHAQTIAVGDGSNDLPMMSVAGLSVAWHAKPRVRAEAMVCINEGGLDRLLEVLRPESLT